MIKLIGAVFAGAAGLAAINLSSAQAASASVQTLHQGVLAISMQDQMPYAGYKDSTSITGLDGDIVTYIAGKLGLTLSVARSDWPGALAAAQTCRTDAVVGPVGWTKERAATGLFTDPTYYTPTMFTEQPNLNIDSIETMKNHTIGIPQGYLLIPTLKSLPGITVKIYPQVSSIYEDISTGRLDAGIIDPLAQVYVAKQRPELKLKNVLLKDPSADQLKADPALQELLPAVNTYLLCKKDADLEKKMSAVLDGMWRSGAMLDLVKKWGGDESYLKAFPYMTSMRAGVDRPQGWTSPSGGS
ncbi:ABC transporter substrate-binding protein [Acidisoma sp. S159]|uniref:substrate-binding periplasmic protein n=1 Tax=Acidisoma sp. S159 TaxID=1747225 RepID=UPI00131D84E7|nr:transporter substrate-binding domain-containing protein [Acidisoma sp. S159]